MRQFFILFIVKPSLYFTNYHTKFYQAPSFSTSIGWFDSFCWSYIPLYRMLFCRVVEVLLKRCPWSVFLDRTFFYFTVNLRWCILKCSRLGSWFYSSTVAAVCFKSHTLCSLSGKIFSSNFSKQPHIIYIYQWSCKFYPLIFPCVATL